MLVPVTITALVVSYDFFRWRFVRLIDTNATALVIAVGKDLRGPVLLATAEKFWVAWGMPSERPHVGISA